MSFLNQMMKSSTEQMSVESEQESEWKWVNMKDLILIG